MLRQCEEAGEYFPFLFLEKVNNGPEGFQGSFQVEQFKHFKESALNFDFLKQSHVNKCLSGN